MMTLAPWLILGLVGMFVFHIVRKRYKEYAKRRDVEHRAKVTRAERVGLYLSPPVTNILLRIGFSLTAGFLLVGMLVALDWSLATSIIPWWGALALSVLFSALFALNDKLVHVPAAHVAIVTFLGQRLNIYLEEGDHYWYAGKLGFGWSNAPLPNREPYKHESSEKEGEGGFVYIGDRPISIWPNRKEKNNFTLDNVSGDGSALFTTLTTTSKVYWPLQWANSDDPILDIAERSRSGQRTIASFLPGFDNVKMQSIFSGLMGGDTLVTAYTSEPVDIFDRGSVIQDRGGGHIFEMVEYRANETEASYKARVEEATNKVKERIENEADPRMYPTVLGKDGQPNVQARHLKDHLVPVLTDCGTHLERATVSSIKMSKEVQDQANKAAGESFQRRGQQMNAATMREASKTMREELSKPNGETALAAALAADGKGTFSHVHVSGGDALTRAAVAGAKSIGDKK